MHATQYHDVLIKLLHCTPAIQFHYLRGYMHAWGSYYKYVFFHECMQVFIPTIKLLTDSQLRELGLEGMGDMAQLRRRCQESEQSKWYIATLASIAFMHAFFPAV